MALMPRATNVLQWPVQNVSKSASLSSSDKTGPSSDWSLQLDSMKLESLVIADQNAAVNTFPGLVHTARHAMGVGVARSGLWVTTAIPMTGVKS